MKCVFRRSSLSSPAGETETWAKSPPASQQAPGLRCSVAPRAQNQVQPQRLPDVASLGGEGEFLLRSQSPALYLQLWKGVCMCLCVCG